MFARELPMDATIGSCSNPVRGVYTLQKRMINLPTILNLAQTDKNTVWLIGTHHLVDEDIEHDRSPCLKHISKLST